MKTLQIQIEKNILEIKYRKKVIKIIGVYSITNLKNGHIYIGESFDIERRWNQHKQDLVKGCHHNYYLQQSFNNYGKKYFSFKVLQEIKKEELEKTSANIIESLLLMLESAYIKKFQLEGITLYNIENTLEEIINGNRKLQINTDISMSVLSSYYIKYKYIFNLSKNVFELKERDSIFNIIKNNSTIKSRTRQKETEQFITNDLKEKCLYKKYTYSHTYTYFIEDKQISKTIVELNEEGIKYLLENYDFESFRKKRGRKPTKEKVDKPTIDDKDKNTLKDLQQLLFKEKILREDYLYDDFREILVKENFITIDKETNNSIPTKYATNNGYIIIRKYYEDKNKYLFYITQNGINKILKK